MTGWAPRQADTLRRHIEAKGSRIAESGVKPPHSKLRSVVSCDVFNSGFVPGGIKLSITFF
jgi:hypothetical protein